MLYLFFIALIVAVTCRLFTKAVLPRDWAETEFSNLKPGARIFTLIALMAVQLIEIAGWLTVVFIPLLWVLETYYKSLI